MAASKKKLNSKRTLLTRQTNNLYSALMSLSINKMSLRNVVYGVITWSCSLCGCLCANILCRACRQMSGRTCDWPRLHIVAHCVCVGLFLLIGLMVGMRTCCALCSAWDSYHLSGSYLCVPYTIEAKSKIREPENILYGKKTTACPCF